MRSATDGERTTSDGRALRSERSRKKIVDALFELVGEGHAMPTAKQVADRADLGIRTVFRHFDDMDNLFEQMHERLRTEIATLTHFEIPEGPTRVRLDELVRLRCQLFERTSPWWKATEAQRSRSPYLTRTHQSLAPKMRSNLFTWLPEFRALPTDLTDALELVISPEAWHRLRVEQKLGVKRAAVATRRAVFALCGEYLD